MVKKDLKSSKRTKSSKSSKSSKIVKKELSKENLIKMKESVTGIIGISIFITILVIFLLSYITYYLYNLKKCDCFQDKDNESTANINYLIIIEAFGIIMNIIVLSLLISLYMVLTNSQGGGAHSSESKIIAYIGILIYIIIYGFFVYNVYKLNKNVSIDCKCTQHPVRFLLYLQGVVIFINLLSMIYLLLSIFANSK